MDRESIIKEVNQVMMDGFELTPSQLTPNAKILEDLELDSLDAIDMLVYLEDKINIKVDTEAFKTVKTLEDVYTVVDDVMNKSNN